MEKYTLDRYNPEGISAGGGPTLKQLKEVRNKERQKEQATMR